MEELPFHEMAEVTQQTPLEEDNELFNCDEKLFNILGKSDLLFKKANHITTLIDTAITAIPSSFEKEKSILKKLHCDYLDVLNDCDDYINRVHAYMGTEKEYGSMQGLINQRKNLVERFWPLQDSAQKLEEELGKILKSDFLLVRTETVEPFSIFEENLKKTSDIKLESKLYLISNRCWQYSTNQRSKKYFAKVALLFETLYTSKPNAFRSKHQQLLKEAISESNEIDFMRQQSVKTQKKLMDTLNESSQLFKKANPQKNLELRLEEAVSKIQYYKNFQEEVENYSFIGESFRQMIAKTIKTFEDFEFIIQKKLEIQKSEKTAERAKQAKQETATQQPILIPIGCTTMTFRIQKDHPVCATEIEECSQKELPHVLSEAQFKGDCTLKANMYLGTADKKILAKTLYFFSKGSKIISGKNAAKPNSKKSLIPCDRLTFLGSKKTKEHAEFDMNNPSTFLLHTHGGDYFFFNTRDTTDLAYHVDRIVALCLEPDQLPAQEPTQAQIKP